MMSLVEMGMTVDDVMHDLKLYIKSKQELKKIKIKGSKLKWLIKLKVN